MNSSTYMERASRLFGRLKLPANFVSPEALALAGWPVAVGKRIASHTKAVSLSGSRLIVDVEDGVWQSQLAVLRGQILRKLEEVLGSSMVSEIEFRLAVARRLPQRAERPKPAADEADEIQDPVLRRIYKEKRKRASA